MDIEKPCGQYTPGVYNTNMSIYIYVNHEKSKSSYPFLLHDVIHRQVHFHWCTDQIRELIIQSSLFKQLLTKEYWT